MKRNHFIKTVGSFGFASFGLPVKTLTVQQDEPPLDRVIVEEFVAAAHKDIDLVKSMMTEYPTLLNAAHDWGFGDFETGLGAASHVGYKELAQYLISRGAQINIFTAALFGRIDILKSILEFFPAGLNAKGPHGYTLLHHAEQGGAEALELKEYLMSLGARETIINLY